MCLDLSLTSGLVFRKIVELASSLKATFEPVLLLHLYPRSSIDIYIQVLELDGGTFPSLVSFRGTS